MDTVGSTSPGSHPGQGLCQTPPPPTPVQALHGQWPDKPHIHMAGKKGAHKHMNRRTQKQTNEEMRGLWLWNDHWERESQSQRCSLCMIGLHDTERHICLFLHRRPTRRIRLQPFFFWWKCFPSCAVCFIIHMIKACDGHILLFLKLWPCCCCYCPTTVKKRIWPQQLPLNVLLCNSYLKTLHLVTLWKTLNKKSWYFKTNLIVSRVLFIWLLEATDSQRLFVLWTEHYMLELKTSPRLQIKGHWV